MSAIAGRVEYAPKIYGSTISADFNSDKVAEVVADQKRFSPKDRLIALVANERAIAIGGSIQYNDPTREMQSGRTKGRCAIIDGPNHEAWENNAALADSLIDTHNLFERFRKPEEYDRERFTEQFWISTKKQRQARTQNVYKKEPTKYKLRIDWLKKVRWLRGESNCNIEEAMSHEK